MRARKTLTLAALTAGIVAVPAHAADPTPDPCRELRAQLQDHTVTEITIDGKLCTGTYAIFDDVVIRGVNGGGFSRAEDGDSENRSLTIDNDAKVTLSNLVFKGATDGEGQTGPGGVTFTGLEKPVVVDQTRQGRTATDQEGALTVTGSRFEDLDSAPGTEGGGLRADLEQAGGDRASLTITDSQFVGNRAVTRGGGVYVELPVGPGVSSSATPPVTISGTTFDGNRAGDDVHVAGGGLFIGGKALPTSRSRRADTVSGADYDVALDGNDYTRNVAYEGDGGGAEFDGVRVHSQRENYLSNQATGDFSEGGGISVSTISELNDFNEVPTLLQASFTGVNDVFAGNSVRRRGYGAGIYAGNPSDDGCGISDVRIAASECGTTVDLTHVTVTGNTGGPGATAAGIGTDDGDSLTVDRSIVWGNTNAPVEDLPRAAASDQPEIDTDGGDLDVTRTDYCAPSIMRAADADGNLCVDPLLTRPAASATELPDVHQTASSPTIDAVGDLAVENGRSARRGTATVVAGDYERPTADSRTANGRPDMGADEYVPVKKTTPPQDPGSDTPTGDKPAGQAPAQTTGGGQVLGQTAQSPAVCSGLRYFRITLRKRRGPFKSAKIWVNGKPVEVTITRKGRATTRVDLRKYERRVIRVRISAVTTKGKRLTGRRTYHPCRPSLDDGRPPKL